MYKKVLILVGSFCVAFLLNSCAMRVDIPVKTDIKEPNEFIKFGVEFTKAKKSEYGGYLLYFDLKIINNHNKKLWIDLNYLSFLENQKKIETPYFSVPFHVLNYWVEVKSLDSETLDMYIVVDSLGSDFVFNGVVNDFDDRPMFIFGGYDPYIDEQIDSLRRMIELDASDEELDNKLEKKIEALELKKLEY